MDKADVINSLNSDSEVYPFVVDINTMRVVAEGAFPQVVGLPALFLHDADRPWTKILADLKVSEGVWVEYVFYNPEMRSYEVKASYLVLHEGYVFGSGYYMSPDDGAIDAVDAMLRLYDDVGEDAFADVVSVPTDALTTPFVLDVGTLEIVAHAGTGLSGEDVREAIDSVQSLEFVSDMLDRYGNLWLSYPSVEPAPGAEYTRAYLLQHDGYVFASGYGVDAESRLQSLVDESVRLYEREGAAAFDAITSMDMTRQTVYDVEESKLVAVAGSPNQVGIVVPLSAVAFDQTPEEFLASYEHGGAWTDRFLSGADSGQLRQITWSILHDGRYVFSASHAYSPEAAVVAEVDAAMVLYKKHGEAAFDYINWQAVNPVIIYPYVVDAETWETVAHSTIPGRVGVCCSHAIAAYNDLDAVREELESNSGVWVEYAFFNPITGQDEYKRVWLAMYDDYIFGSGYYYGNFDRVEGIIATTIADYNANGEAVFGTINSEVSGSLYFTPIVLDYDTLDVVAHGGYLGLEGQNIDDITFTGYDLAAIIKASLVEDGGSVLVAAASMLDLQTGFPVRQSLIFQLHDGYVFAAAQPVVIYTR